MTRLNEKGTSVLNHPWRVILMTSSFYLFGSKSWIEAWKFFGLLVMVFIYCLKARTKPWRQFPSGLTCINPNNSGFSEAWWHEFHSRYSVKMVFILIHRYPHISPLCHGSPVLWLPCFSLSCPFFREFTSLFWEAKEKTTEKLIFSALLLLPKKRKKKNPQEELAESA